MPHLRIRNPRIDLQRLLSDEQLPALPQSAIRLLELSRDPQNGPTEYAVPIEADPGLASQVLRFVNSSFFGFRHEIASIRTGISLVGVRTIRNFALWSAVFSLLPDPKCGPFELKKLWRDSLRRGLFARTVGASLRVAQLEDLFVAALLQDMAIPLLAGPLAAQYEQLLRSRNRGELRLSDLEREEFGWTHAEAGGIIARRWHLPDFSTRLIQGHGAAELGNPPSAAREQAAVVLSAWLPGTDDDFWPEYAQWDHALRGLMGTNGQSVADMLAAVDRDFARFAPFFRVPLDGKSLTELLAQQTPSVCPSCS